MSESLRVILAVNIGSSSIKYAAYPIANATKGTLLAAQIQGNLQGLEASRDRFGQAFETLKDQLSKALGSVTIAAVAHRVVHGGERYTKSVCVTDQVLKDLHTLDSLAPLHQPFNLQGIAAFQEAFPGVPQIACFDTAFHAALPETEKAFPLTRALFQKGVHRYGFHGLSYRYVLEKLSSQTSAAQKRLLMAHLGNGASLCACVNGKSVATTMGFSAVGGLMMGTRCGDLDPGVMLYLMQQGMSAQDMESLFYRESGLKGMSGISADMRQLRNSTAPEAAFAIALFEQRVIREAGGLVALMGGVDAIAFTGGIGENDVMLRERICNSLQFLGLSIDSALNQGATNTGAQALHVPQSAVEIWVVPTDEGMVAAQEALALLR